VSTKGISKTFHNGARAGETDGHTSVNAGTAGGWSEAARSTAVLRVATSPSATARGAGLRVRIASFQPAEDGISQRAAFRRFTNWTSA
jgi:hypothetical protein